MSDQTTDQTAIDPEDVAMISCGAVECDDCGCAAANRILAAHTAAVAEIERLRKWLSCMEHWMRQIAAKEIPVIDPEAFEGFDEWLENERSRKPPVEEPQYQNGTPGTVVAHKVSGLAALSQRELDDAVAKHPPAVESNLGAVLGGPRCPPYQPPSVSPHIPPVFGGPRCPPYDPPAVPPSKIAEEMAHLLARELVSVYITASGLGNVTLAETLIHRAIDFAVAKDREGREPC